MFGTYGTLIGAAVQSALAYTVDVTVSICTIFGHLFKDEPAVFLFLVSNMAPISVNEYAFGPPPGELLVLWPACLLACI
ncbi:hypothetical protein B0O99DRAFT_641052 [Bisporella sp. PMI_857]|nr:hypothetical protein B0O99DRAFT_641052 [Bisporella sp. PMI_857]